MVNEIRVTCPECRHLLIIDRATGEILEVRKPRPEDSSGDELTDALKRVRESEGKLEEKVKDARERQRDMAEGLDSVFKKALKRAEEEGPKKPDGPLWD